MKEKKSVSRTRRTVVLRSSIPSGPHTLVTLVRPSLVGTTLPPYCFTFAADEAEARDTR